MSDYASYKVQIADTVAEYKLARAASDLTSIRGEAQNPHRMIHRPMNLWGVLNKRLSGQNANLRPQLIETTLP